MRVGIDAHALGSLSSGNEMYFEQLIQHLAETATNGIRDVVYYTHPSGARRVPSSEKLQLKRIRPATPFWRIPVGFPLEFRKEKLDIFHAQHVIPPFCKCKTVTSIHDIAYEHFPESFSRFETLGLKVLVRRSAQRADHIITLSNYSKEDIAKTYDIDPRKITVTYLGAGDQYFPSDKEKCREQIAAKYGVTAPFLLYAGGFRRGRISRGCFQHLPSSRKKGSMKSLRW